MALLLQRGAEPLPGYRLIEPLGEGGFGQVWQAEAPGGFHVALKFIRLDSRAEPELRALDAVRELRHPFLLDIHFAQQVGDRLIIATSLCEQSLADRLKEVNRQGLPGIPVDELLRYMEETAEALDYLNRPHLDRRSGKSVRVQHRDIKPHNLFLVGGAIKVADFGLAKILEGSVAFHTGNLTPAYAPPEVYRNQTSSRSDQFSLAVTYYQLRTSLLPFKGNSTEIMHQVLCVEPELPGLSSAEKQVVLQALSKDPNDRWPDCQTFVMQLRNAALADSAEQRQTQGPESTKRNVDVVRRVIPTTPTGVKKRSTALPWLAGAVAGVFIAALLLMKFSSWEGKLVVECDPARDPDALVLNDRLIPVPAAQAGIALKPGKYRLFAERKGCATILSEFEIQRGRTAIVQIAFPPPTPSLVATDKPSSQAVAAAAATLNETSDPRVLPAEYLLNVPNDANVAVVKGQAIVEVRSGARILRIPQPDPDEPVEIRVEKEGYIPVARKLTARAGETAPLIFQLAPLPATVQLKATPTDLRLAIEPPSAVGVSGVGGQRTVTVANPLEVPSLTIRAEHPDYLPLSRTIQLAPGDDLDVELLLEPKPARIRVKLDPPTAQLGPLAAGAFFSRSDQSILVDRPTGKTLTFSATSNGYYDASQTVVATPGLETTVALTLQPKPAVFAVAVEPADAQLQVEDGQASTRYGTGRRREIVQDNPDGVRSFTVSVNRSGYEPATRQLVGKPGGYEELELRLRRQAPPLALAPFNQEEASRYQKSCAVYHETSVAFTDANGHRLILIPPGRFEMGSRESPEEIARIYDDKPDFHRSEHPLHNVEITKAFYLGSCEVTVGEFARFVRETGYVTDAEKDPQNIGRFTNGQTDAVGSRSWKDVEFAQNDEHAVVLVSRRDALAYCRWMSETEKVRYRLPTEAEWEFACRAGTVTRYFFGDNPEDLRFHANVPDQSLRRAFPDSKAGVSGDDGFAFTAPVGSFRPNPFGLYDMHGNVWEMCADYFSADYYAKSPVKDPGGPFFGSRYVIRGACWY